jgi:hypothetical protein
LQIDATLGRKAGNPIASLRTARARAALEQFLEVNRILDRAAAIPAAGVTSDLGAIFGDNPNGLVVGANEHAPSDEARWHRISVGIEPNTRFFGNDRGRDEIGVSGTLRQRSQARALDQQALGGPLARGGVNTLIGDLIAPFGGLNA